LATRMMMLRKMKKQKMLPRVRKMKVNKEKVNLTMTARRVVHLIPHQVMRMMSI